MIEIYKATVVVSLVINIVYIIAVLQFGFCTVSRETRDKIVDDEDFKEQDTATFRTVFNITSLKTRIIIVFIVTAISFIPIINLVLTLLFILVSISEILNPDEPK